MPFQKGQSGNPKGRPLGSQSKASQAFKAFCAKQVTDTAYLGQLRQRLHDGKLPPILEAKVWDVGAPQDPKGTHPGVVVNIGFLTQPAEPHVLTAHVLTLQTGNPTHAT